MAGKTIEELIAEGARLDQEQRDAPNMTYSPDAEARAIRAATPPRVGGGETYFGHAASSVPLGNRVVDLLTTIFNRDQGVRAELTPQARQELLAIGDEVPPTAPPASIVEDYRRIRDERKERQDYGALQNPNMARAGTATGFVTSLAAPLPGANLGKAAKVGAGASTAARIAASPIARRIAGGALTGAGYGALGGLTDGDADLTRGEFIEGLGDTLKGAAVGTAFGAGGAVLGEGARAAAPWLRRMAIQRTREHVNGDSDVLAVRRNPVRDESLEQVLDDGMVKPFANVNGLDQRIKMAVEVENAKLGDIIRKLEERGFSGPNARAVAEKLMARYDEVYANTGSNKTSADVFKNEATNLTDPKVLPQGQTNLTLSRSEAIKRDLQKQANFDKRHPTGKEESLREASSMIRQADEDVILEQAAARGRGDKIIANRFKPQKERLGKYLDVEAATDRAAAKFNQKNRTGLRDDIVGTNADSILGSKLLAELNAQVRSRGASTAAVGLNNASQFAAAPGTSSAFGAAAAQVAPYAMDRARSWLDEKSLEDLSALPDEELGEYAGPLKAAAARGADSLKAMDKVLRDTDPKWRELRARLSGSQPTQ